MFFSYFRHSKEIKTAIFVVATTRLGNYAILDCAHEIKRGK